MSTNDPFITFYSTVSKDTQPVQQEVYAHSLVKCIKVLGTCIRSNHTFNFEVLLLEKTSKKRLQRIIEKERITSLLVHNLHILYNL